MKYVRPMRVVLGGPVALDHTVGRDLEKQAVLAAIQDGYGALLTGDRRFGKTVLRRLVVHELRDQDVHVVEVSAERESYADFVQALAVELRKLGGAFAKVVDTLSVREVTLGSVLKVARDSPAAASRALDELVRKSVQAAAPNKLVLVIDETTVLASAMERRHHGDGIGFLHVLRRLRQENEGRLCMVLLGSVGFHHVTPDALATTNDLETVPVRAISLPDADFLAQCLLLGEQVPCTDPAAVADAIAYASEQIPYYVHHLVRSSQRWTMREQRPIPPAAVPGLLDAALTDPDDPWNLRHYRERIPVYYGAPAESLIGAILDCYAASTAPMSVDEVLRLLAASGPPPARLDLLRLIDRLEADHYLQRIGADDRFASQIIRRAWLTFRR